jgi:hypothetical protein
MGFNSEFKGLNSETGYFILIFVFFPQYLLRVCSVLIFVAAPCMLVVSSPLFVQLIHTNYYKIIKLLKSVKILILANIIILNDFNNLTIL